LHKQKRGFAFYSGKSQLLTGDKKQNPRNGAAMRGSSLGLFCRPSQDHRTKRGNPGVLPTTTPTLTPGVIWYKSNYQQYNKIAKKSILL